MSETDFLVVAISAFWPRFNFRFIERGLSKLYQMMLEWMY